jgi:DNA-directed RNA polymerase I subunit RPA2
VRRQRLFRNPPKDRTAYPTLAAAVDPHIESFDSIFAKGGLLDEAVRDIGTKIFLDGNPYERTEDAGPRNRLHVRIKELFFAKPVLPTSNKHALKNRNILPSECRERHATYRGRLSARIEYKVNNGDWQELVRELGHLPIMLRVSKLQSCGQRRCVDANCARDSRTGATSTACPRTSSSRPRKKPRSSAATSSSTASRK